METKKQWVIPEIKEIDINFNFSGPNNDDEGYNPSVS